MNCSTLLATVLLAAAPFAGDTVNVTPASPTTRDSLTFSLFNERHCCCAEYHYKAVTVNDTTILLG